MNANLLPIFSSSHFSIETRSRNEREMLFYIFFVFKPKQKVIVHSIHREIHDVIQLYKTYTFESSVIGFDYYTSIDTNGDIVILFLFLLPIAHHQ